MGLGRLKIPSEVPWHIVLNAKDSISMSVLRRGSDWIQCEFFGEGGIPVNQYGRLAIRKYLCRELSNKL